MDKRSGLEYDRKRYKYPTRYDVEQTLGKFARKEFVEDFSKARGIFVTKATRDQLAEKLSYFFFDDDDIEEIRDVAYKTSRTQTLSGFSVVLDEGAGLVDSIKTALTNNEFDKHVEVGPLTRTGNQEIEEYKAEVTYVSKKPGRIEFLQEESRTFDLVVRKSSETEYQVLSVGNKATDDKVCQRIVKKSIKRRGKILSLDFDDLSTPQTIMFFDELANDGIQGDWNLLEVCKLVLRRGEDEQEDVSPEELLGINQAVLDGDNLRNNSFVKQTEKNGYRFMSMTYRFEHKEEPFVIDIRAEFKLRPKVYQVDVAEFYEVDGVTGIHQKKIMDPELMYIVKDKLWNSSRRIFKEVRKKR